MRSTERDQTCKCNCHQFACFASWSNDSTLPEDVHHVFYVFLASDCGVVFFFSGSNWGGRFSVCSAVGVVPLSLQQLGRADGSEVAKVERRAKGPRAHQRFCNRQETFPKISQTMNCWMTPCWFNQVNPLNCQVWLWCREEILGWSTCNGPSFQRCTHGEDAWHGMWKSHTHWLALCCKEERCRIRWVLAFMGISNWVYNMCGGCVYTFWTLSIRYYCYYCLWWLLSSL